MISAWHDNPPSLQWHASGLPFRRLRMRARKARCAGWPSHTAYARTALSCSLRSLVLDMPDDRAIVYARFPYVVGP